MNSLSFDHVTLRELLPEHVGQNYLSWLSDKAVTRYTEISPSQTHEQVVDYVRKTNTSQTDRIWRIMLNERHVGNVRLSGISAVHARSAVAILIGDRSAWGRGVGSTAINLVSAYAFDDLRLHKLTAGIYAPNVASIKAFTKAGFHIEATLRNHRRFNGSFVDEFVLARFAPPPDAKAPESP